MAVIKYSPEQENTILTLRAANIGWFNATKEYNNIYSEGPYRSEDALKKKYSDMVLQGRYPSVLLPAHISA